MNQKRMKRMSRSCDERLDVLGGLRLLGILPDHRRCATAIDGSPPAGYRRLAEDAAASVIGRSVAGDGGDEVGHVFGFLALVEQRRHLAEAAGAAFCDRV